MDLPEGFYKVALSFEDNLFIELSTSIAFEQVAKGRKGNHLVDVQEQKIPVVRSTNLFSIPAHVFTHLHQQIVTEIMQKSPQSVSPSFAFNNALIEIYDEQYTKMKFHSDQCLDVAPQSYIAIFSCYETPDSLNKHTLRTLKVKNKATLEEVDIPLDHHTVVLFSTETNSLYHHKIIATPIGNRPAQLVDVPWLGITFRSSKTFIEFNKDTPYLSTGQPLTLADETQRKAFYKIRGEENKQQNFVFPDITYTLNQGDILPPTHPHLSVKKE